MKGCSWVSGDGVEKPRWEWGLLLNRPPSESRFLRIKDGIIQPFIWTMELVYLQYDRFLSFPPLPSPPQLCCSSVLSVVLNFQACSDVPASFR